MKKMNIRAVLFLLPGMLLSCNVFGPVDPLAPAISKLEIVAIRRTEITVSGSINKPDFENDRQEKKSGEIIEYGLVYGTNQNLNMESGRVVKLGTTGTLPITIQNQNISGLVANTQYYVAIYARNEGGGMAYSEIVNVKTVDQPGIFTSKVSVKVTMPGGSYYDLDEGKLVPKGDAQADISVDIFTISGRGTVLAIAATDGAIFKNLGIIDFNAITYLGLLNTTGYSPDGVSVIMNANAANTVIAFKTKSGRYGKWRLESLTGSELTMSLVSYEN
ncbi:MAG: fibronectin type III domain-containing protein [Dyadobacter sp.]|uniref:fibronectin type III domain-containing protein n=1 Tax=Dyadobacter sp. TaxID=1914288 RepID=UPI0032662FFD